MQTVSFFLSKFLRWRCRSIKIFTSSFSADTVWGNRKSEILKYWRIEWPLALVVVILLLPWKPLHNVKKQSRSCIIKILLKYRLYVFSGHMDWNLLFPLMVSSENGRSHYCLCHPVEYNSPRLLKRELWVPENYLIIISYYVIMYSTITTS